MIPYFEQLGREVERNWRAQRYESAALPELAREALVARPPAAHTSLEEIAEVVLRSTGLPRQELDRPGRFGDPPVSLYESDELAVQALVWTDGTTSIHDHAFVGAFSLLEGASVHTTFRFASQQSCGPRIQIGELTRSETELLRPGDVRTIHAADDSLHSLFHLDLPSVTVVVRSMGLAVTGPQWAYLPPGLAYDPFHQPVTLDRQLRLLQSLRLIGPERVTGVLPRYVVEQGAHAAVMAVLAVARGFADQSAVEEALIALDSTHDVPRRLMRDVLEREVRRTNITGRRRAVTDAGLRFFLALLLTIETREELLQMTSAETSDADPVPRILSWLRQLQSDALTSNDPDAGLGISLSEADLWTLEGLLRGKSEAELFESVESSQVDGLTGAAVQRACFLLPNMRILKPLFTTSDDG